MKLNHSKLKSFFIGTLLGDSYIRDNIFYCKQISKDLIEFKAKIIKQYLPDAIVKIKEIPAYIDKNNVHHQTCYCLSASKSRYIKKLYNYFYVDGKKTYRQGMIQKLDTLGLAMWYADDGTTIIVQKGRSRRVQICTDNFSPEEHEMIKNDLINIGINDIKIVDRKRRGQLRIQINGIFRQTLLISISDYFYNYFPSLLYKMDLGYRFNQLDSRYVLPEYKSCYLKISAHNEFVDRIRYDIV